MALKYGSRKSGSEKLTMFGVRRGMSVQGVKPRIDLDERNKRVALALANTSKKMGLFQFKSFEPLVTHPAGIDPNDRNKGDARALASAGKKMSLFHFTI